MDIVRLALSEGWLEQAVFVEKVRKEFGPSVEPYLTAFYEMMRNMPEAKGRVRGASPTVAKAEPSASKTDSIDLGGGVKLDLVWIETGTFMMGSPAGEKDRFGDELQHPVTLTKGYWLGKYPVTQEQWERVMGSNPSYFKGARNPVEEVSWDDCQEFIQELNRRVSGGGFGLPTEAQWEYACRAGSTGAYCFGDDEDRLVQYAWYPENCGHTTHPVGEKKPNAWGLHDMHGNVWEWCQDWWDSYSSGAQTDPTGAASGSRRVSRGGSCGDFARLCRSADRISRYPDDRDFNKNGFRLTRTLP